MLIDAKIKYLQDAVERVGRLDWKHIATDVLVELGIALTLTQVQVGRINTDRGCARPLFRRSPNPSISVTLLTTNRTLNSGGHRFRFNALNQFLYNGLGCNNDLGS